MYLELLIKKANDEQKQLMINMNGHVGGEYGRANLVMYVEELERAGRIDGAIAETVINDKCIFEVLFMTNGGQYYAYSSCLESACKQLVEEMQYA